MESFTIELVSNASAQLFPDSTRSSCTNFLPEQLNLEDQCEVAISEISYPSMYQNLTVGKLTFFDKKVSKSAEFYYLEPGIYYCITDIVEAMNTLIHERHNHNKKCITVKMSRRTQKVEIYFENERSGLAFSSTDLGHIVGSNVGKEFGAMSRENWNHKPDFADRLVRIHSLMKYTDLIEYNILGDAKAPLLRCFLYIWKLKAGHLITTGQYMNCQTFSNLLFRPLLKNSFHSILIDLRDESGDKIPFVSVGISRLVLMFKKPPKFISNLKDVTRWLLQDK